MPYTIPTSAEFKARFPVFDSMDDGIVDVLISEAATYVSESWAEADYKPAIMYLAAHFAVEEGYTGRFIDAAGPLTSSKLGDASDSYASAQNADSTGVYSSTSYGKRFMQYQRRNVAGVLLL